MTAEAGATIYRFVTLAEAAELTSLSDRHLRELIARGAIPVWQPSRQTIRVPYWVLIEKVSRENGLSLPGPRLVDNGEAFTTGSPSSRRQATADAGAEGEIESE